MEDEIQDLKEEEKAYSAEPERGREERDGGSWIVGLVLIALGGLFLLSNVLDVSGAWFGPSSSSSSAWASCSRSAPGSGGAETKNGRSQTGTTAINRL